MRLYSQRDGRWCRRRQRRRRTCFPRDSVGGTALRTRGRFSALMRHPAGTIWRAHRDPTRTREDYNILAPSLLLSSRPLRRPESTRIPRRRLISLILVSPAKTLVIARTVSPRPFSTSDAFQKGPKWFRALLWFSYCTHDFNVKGSDNYITKISRCLLSLK